MISTGYVSSFCFSIHSIFSWRILQCLSSGLSQGWNLIFFFLLRTGHIFLVLCICNSVGLCSGYCLCYAKYVGGCAMLFFLFLLLESHCISVSSSVGTGSDLRSVFKAFLLLFGVCPMPVPLKS